MCPLLPFIVYANNRTNKRNFPIMSLEKGSTLFTPQNQRISEKNSQKYKFHKNLKNSAK